MRFAAIFTLTFLLTIPASLVGSEGVGPGDPGGDGDPPTAPKICLGTCRNGIGGVPCDPANPAFCNPKKQCKCAATQDGQNCQCYEF